MLAFVNVYYPLLPGRGPLINEGAAFASFTTKTTHLLTLSHTQAHTHKTKRNLTEVETV